MKFTALTSGSSGNCFYIEDNNQAILIDVGLSTKQILKRMESIHLDPKKLAAIFITHEHIDHVRGVDVLARKFSLPIYATQKTLKSSFICKDASLLHPIKNTQTIKIGDLTVQAFPKSHAAADPVSYTISNKDNHICVITDAGHPCLNIIEHISKADAICLETNYDINMLLNGPYPAFLKAWISSDNGHLSNMQAALTLLEHASPNLKHLVLSHISETNNAPQVAKDTILKTLAHRSDLIPSIHLSDREPLPLLSL